MKARTTLMQMEDACNRLIAENDKLKVDKQLLVEVVMELSKELQNEWEDVLRPFCHDDAAKHAREVINRVCATLSKTGGVVG